MLRERLDIQRASITDRLFATSGFEITELSRDKLEAKVGEIHIAVVTAKEPYKDWDRNLREQVITARQWYWKLWGMVPLEDELDEVSYVDVAKVSYPGSETNEVITEGLTMRTVLINGREFDDNNNLPDDLRFFVGPKNIPLFDLIVEKLFSNNRELAKEKVVAASRVAPIRPEGQKHNLYTPEAFAAIQVKAAYRAARDGVEYFVNTMRPEMDIDVLSLPDGTNYSHTRTEDVLGLDNGSIELDRDDPFVLGHVFNYLGYFTNTQGFIKLIKAMIKEGSLSGDILRNTIGINPSRLSDLKATEFKPFIALVKADGPITPNLTGEEFRRRITEEVSDGPFSYTMTVAQRKEAGIRILEQSPVARSRKLQLEAA